MIFRTVLDTRLEIDTTARTAVLVFTVPAASGEGDVAVFTQDITNRLSADDRRRLRHLLNATPNGGTGGTRGRTRK